MYIAQLRDGRFYVGISQYPPPALLAHHQAGRHAQFARVEGVTSVLWTEIHPSLESARRREVQLKRWSHAKKQALIDGDVERLKRLARSRHRR
ncbi:MAG: GIY-YIG nuclease family protein [Planctomycetes bacterium]|nr:GIY-YIG nuclease family protein [Planctomycetota bacterium]